MSERQVMVFTGDWNGGERSFRLAGEHELTLESVARVDLAGGEVDVRPGDLTRTDEYAWPDCLSGWACKSSSDSCCPARCRSRRAWRWLCGDGR